MTPLMKGALIEYGEDFMGPIPNVVLFQFNPESLSRTIQIPSRPTGAASRETSQAGEIPVESISLTAHFSAAQGLNDNHPLARLFGIDHQLAALEKMVRPAGRISQGLQQAIDSISNAISSPKQGNPTQAIPRESYPRILFIWGESRVLPVTIDSMTINEQEYDMFLHPIRAEVSLGLSAINVGHCSDDEIARGALEFTNLAKEERAIANLANTVITPIVELVSF
jgi:hypothetical protein